MDELILVDLADRQIGTMEKAEAHRLGKLHRAFSVFLVSGDRMLLQRRNKEKYHSGGLWANACCSHPRNGETLAEAVPRRLQEELGVSCEVKELFDFVYFSKYAEDLFEYECDHVFLGTCEGPFSPDPGEIEAVEWVTFDALEQRLLNTPEEFCSWFRIAAPKVLQMLRKDA